MGEMWTSLAEVGTLGISQKDERCDLRGEQKQMAKDLDHRGYENPLKVLF